MDLINLTEFLVKQIIPTAEVEINKIDSDSDTVIQVLVPNEFMSIIIGKGGNIANSIRTIVQAASYTNKLGRVRINIDSK